MADNLETGIEEIAVDSPCSSNRASTISGALPVINILLLGKVGVGKTRLLNEVFQGNTAEARTSTQVVRGVSQREMTFMDGDACVEAKIFDTMRVNRSHPQISISKTVSALKNYMSRIYPNGVNMVLLMYRWQGYSRSELSRMKYILCRLNDNAVPLITALVVNGCVRMKESHRCKITHYFEASPSMELIGRFTLKGIHVVGITDLNNVSEPDQMMHKAVNAKDVDLMRELIRSSYHRQLTQNVFFKQYRYIEVFPWKICPCYDRIYKCWRWGYTWEDCIAREPQMEY